MWTLFERERIDYLYSKIEKFDFSSLFDEKQLTAICIANQWYRMSTIDYWYHIPANQKIISQARFQHLIYEDTNDKNEYAQTNRWRDHFINIIKECDIQEENYNQLAIGFSILAVHPVRLKANHPSPYIYVGPWFKKKSKNQIFAAEALAPYKKHFSTHEEATNYINKVAKKGISKHLKKTFKSAKVYERWEKSGFIPFCPIMANMWITK